MQGHIPNPGAVGRIRGVLGDHSYGIGIAGMVMAGSGRETDRQRERGREGGGGGGAGVGVGSECDKEDDVGEEAWGVRGDRGGLGGGSVRAERGGGAFEPFATCAVCLAQV